MHMQTVDQKWYVLYRWFTLAVASLLLLFALICWFAPGVVPFKPVPEISYFSGILALFTIGWAVALYDRIAAKTTHLESMLILVMLQASTVFSVVQTTGQMGSPFIWWWGVMSFIAAIFGVYGSAGVAFVSVMYFILTSTDMNGHTDYSLRTIITLAVLLVAAGAGQLFWKRFFVDADTDQVALLSGELKASQKQSEILVQALTDGVLLINTEGAITLMNPAAARMTGWTVEEGTGADSRLVVNFKKEDGADLEKADNPLENILGDTRAETATLQLVSRNTSQLVVSVVTSPLVHPKTHEVIGGMIVIRDISATHQSDKQRAEFISTASHEMRTPVAAIEGYLQLALNEKVSKVDPKARDFLTKALESTHHLGQLFQDLLTSAKAEDGRLVSHPEAIEMGDYLEKLSDSFKFSAEKKGLLTNFVFGRSSNGGDRVVRPLYFVSADPDRLREVVTNLFDNAVKYTPSGKITLGLTGNDEVVQLFVHDTGPGIAPEDIPHLFQKFYRVDNSATRTIGGTGLGLFICKKIIELYNGRIWAESEMGKGSTFYINLPRLTTQQAEQMRAQAAQSLGSAPVSSLTTPV
jgi:PAS domain S-box-containing protein